MQSIEFSFSNCEVSGKVWYGTDDPHMLGEDMMEVWLSNEATIFCGWYPYKNL